MVKFPLVRVRLPVMLAAGAITLAVGGCATAPSGGPPRPATGGNSQVQAYVQPLPPPGPTSAGKWQPINVVLGFLHASASYAFDRAAAQQYLVPKLRKAWHPDRGPVTVVGALSAPKQGPYRPQIPRPTQPGVSLETVNFSAQRLATLSQAGQYQYTPGPNVVYQFILAKINGVWLIQGLPPGQPSLLLTEPDFEDVYQARNLFFLAPPEPSQSAAVLVPDPVYAPLQSSNSALNTSLATKLVKGLLMGQGTWLSGATWSAFPPGTQLIKQVTITGQTALVDLGGSATHAARAQIQLMAAQLLATLRDSSYSLPLASQLRMYIDNAPAFISSSGAHANLVAGLTAASLYVVTGANSVDELSAAPKTVGKPVPKLGPAQLGAAVVTAVAASPAGGRQQLAVAVPDGRGCAVYLKPDARSYPLSQVGGECTSLSWDINGNLWAAAGQKVWVLRTKDREPVAVNLSAIPAIGQRAGRILALRMAPDGVRAALLVRTSAGNRLLLGAVRFQNHDTTVSLGPAVAVGNPTLVSPHGGVLTGLADPGAISWSDAYHLAVLAAGEIFDVPLTGGAGQQPPGSPAPAGAITLTSDGSQLVVGTSTGQVFASSATTAGWVPVTKGTNPIYPG